GALIFASDIPKVERTIEEPVAEGVSRFRQMFNDIKEGIDVIRASRGLMLAFLQVSIAVLVLFMLFTLAPAFVSQVIGIAAQDTYVILVPATSGAIVSAIVLGQFLRNLDRARLLATSMIANGITLLGLAAVPQAMAQLPDADADPPDDRLGQVEVAAQQVAGRTDQARPCEPADRAEDLEAPEGHVCHAREHRSPGSQPDHEASREDRLVTVPCEEQFGARDVLRP